MRSLRVSANDAPGGLLPEPLELAAAGTVDRLRRLDQQAGALPRPVVGRLQPEQAHARLGGKRPAVQPERVERGLEARVFAEDDRKRRNRVQRELAVAFPAGDVKPSAPACRPGRASGRF